MTTGVSNEEIHDLSNKLFSSILLEQQKYMAVKGPDEDKKNMNEAVLTEYEQLKGRGFFFNYVSSGKGHGPFTELVDGSVKYDLIGAIGPNLVGHSHPLYIKAHLEAATNDVMMCGNLLTHKEAYNLTKELVDSVKGSRLKHFWFSGSGSFANDTALKMLWQKKDPAHRLIAFEKAFAGRSIATQDITYNPDYRQGQPQTIQVDHVPHFDQNDPENSLENTLNALKELVKKNKDQYCAIMLELIQGEAGFVYGTKEYYEGVFKWAKENNLYIWVDEVQSFARTTELYAFQMFGLEEYVDIVTIGKALQACGTFFTDELNPKPGLVAGTFNGSIASLNAGQKIVHYLKEGNFYGQDGRMKYLEDQFLNRLRVMAKGPLKGKIGYSGGVGTMISFEVGDSTKETTIKFIKKLYDNGILSFMAGKEPTRVRFLLPTCLSDEHIEEIFRIIDKTANEVL
ncbi:aminotransferase class III-fold pyridoxal phosphate-dependent enzyme [Halobacteriovorax sp. HLS]|uniref:aminotransferase class III-fold pyridoxal phosphate-dependent enzyme n=1 Tax=Halobacteriovorax sp. HLS TaxID=2234000 RepID=UPI000FD8ACB9|nr:aminotransferase class III-fold pyridoxal phosphate-dependent enzyme [Halobacteriovorax sp. HLS]